MTHILIVEDDPFLQQLYSDILSGEGYKVTVIDNGKTALQKIKESSWDLILLDVMLPGMDGFTIVKELKNDPTYTHPCPIVFMSNLDNEIKPDMFAGLADGFIVKSNLTPPDLVEKVRSYLQKKP